MAQQSGKDGTSTAGDQVLLAGQVKGCGARRGGPSEYDVTWTEQKNDQLQEASDFDRVPSHLGPGAMAFPVCGSQWKSSGCKGHSVFPGGSE